MKKVFLWGPVALYIGFILWLSSAPRPIPGIQRFPWLDKPCHFFEYAPLGSLLVRAISRTWTGLKANRLHAWAALAALLVGTVDEIYQGFIPLRISSPWDTLADLVGAVAGQFLYRKFAKTP